MVSMAAESLSDPKKSLKDLMERGYGNLISKINQLQEEIEAERTVKIKEKLDKNQKKLQSHVHENMSATHEVNPSVNDILCEVPSLGNESALCIANGFLLGSVDKELANIHEVINAKTTKLPKIERIPPYTTWVFLDRNQRMAEDQSVVGRRRIYYDQSGNEALICSESEDDTPEVEEDKREFSEGEDRILRMAFQEHGSDDDVAEVVSHFIGSTPVEVKERYLELKLKLKLDKPEEQNSSERNMSLEKSLSAVLDSFDNLFCRRCLVFDCRLHGCSQNLVYSSEKQSSLSEAEDRNPCSDHCYLLAKQTTEEVVQGSDERSFYQMDSMVRNNIQEENNGSNVVGIEENVSSAAIGIGCNLYLVSGEGSTADVLSTSTVVPVAHHANIVKRKIIDDNDKEVEGSDGFKQFIDKKSITIQAIEPSAICGEIVSTSAIPSAKIRNLSVESCQYMGGQLKCKHPLKGHCTSITNDYSSQEISCSKACDIVEGGALDINRRPDLKQPTVSLGGQKIQLSSSREWKPLEKDLYVKGLEIFGRNSCLIARNLLSGLKTCNEVSDYMCYSRALMAHERDIVPSSEDNPRADIDRMEQEVLMRSRSRIFRKRGRSRRLKYSTKSNGHPSSWKSNGDGDQSCKQYTPCTCESTCGKDCSCLKKGTCCEKYCGCSKNCKNRFRGCHCAKSQCRSRQCPCFAANRECDPDVCRNCWVSCGGGPLGEPPKKGDGQCGNMRLLLRQQQRILLGKSDVAGWGAFIKNSVNKHDYLGEYTGELISHREADKRGKIYDRANSSFLFDLNDQYVLDACRHGDKLKFANHSSKPNCYCKVMLVAGDHRVGIFAKERIEAKEELFYDYRYGPDQAPAWARRPEAPKKDDYVPSQGRARKHQSR